MRDLDVEVERKNGRGDSLSWLWYVLIFVIIVNAIFFGTLAVFSFIEERRLRKQNEQRGRHQHEG
jgi:hypothetical protein